MFCSHYFNQCAAPEPHSFGGAGPSSDVTLAPTAPALILLFNIDGLLKMALT
jgi:hypothetical protein